MANIGLDEPAQAEASPRKGRRRVMVIAAVVVVALGVTVGVVIPRVIHSQRVAEYTELVEELRLKMDELAEAETALQAATALTHARHSEALLVANAVAVLGETQEPILPAERTESLKDVGTKAADAIGTLGELVGSDEELQALLTTSFIENIEAEKIARAASKEADEDVPETAVASSFAELTIDQAIELIATPISPEDVPVVADEDVTPELIVDLRTTIASVTDDIAHVQESIDSESDRQDFLNATVMSMWPALQETAASIHEYLAEVEAAAAKAEKDVAEETAKAAALVRDSSDAEDVLLLHGLIASYISASEISLTSHAEVVKAEEAEAKRLAEERAAKERAEKERAAKARQNSGSKKSSSDGWASGGLCNYWSPVDGGMYMAPCS